MNGVWLDLSRAQWYPFTATHLSSCNRRTLVGGHCARSVTSIILTNIPSNILL